MSTIIRRRRKAQSCLQAQKRWSAWIAAPRSSTRRKSRVTSLAAATAPPGGRRPDRRRSRSGVAGEDDDLPSLPPQGPPRHRAHDDAWLFAESLEPLRKGSLVLSDKNSRNHILYQARLQAPSGVPSSFYIFEPQKGRPIPAQANGLGQERPSLAVSPEGASHRQSHT